MKISVIIPTYNEIATIGRLLDYLLTETSSHNAEIIVVDGQSPDGTLQSIRHYPVMAVTSPNKGRGAQMNHGASVATGDVLYFLHADSFPPADFVRHIQNSMFSKYKSGCFRLRFDSDHWFLKANAWFTRFDSDWVRFGDQSLFAARDVFEKAGKFREDWVVMEDQEIIPRLKAQGKFRICPGYVTTSARKYLDNGVIWLQVVFFVIWLQWKLGYSQPQLVRTYRKLIRKQDKV